jgi:hypothetical protein
LSLDKNEASLQCILVIRSDRKEESQALVAKITTPVLFVRKEATEEPHCRQMSSCLYSQHGASRFCLERFSEVVHLK